MFVSFHILRSRHFWIPGLATATLLAAVFAWELGAFWPHVWTPPRPPATDAEMIFITLLATLLSIDVGLYGWHRAHGSCPIGTKRATGAAGIIGIATVLCPVCLALPITLFGAAFSIAMLTPYLPLLRMISVILACVTLWLLWPEGARKK